MAQRTKVEYAGRVGFDQVAAYLESIAEGLRKKRIRFGAGGRAIALTPSGVARLEIEASHDPEKARSSIEIELSWHEAEDAAGGELTISSQEEDFPTTSPEEERTFGDEAPGEGEIVVDPGV